MKGGGTEEGAGEKTVIVGEYVGVYPACQMWRPSKNKHYPVAAHHSSPSREATQSRRTSSVTEEGRHPFGEVHGHDSRDVLR